MITDGNPNPSRIKKYPSYKKGGKVKKTGLALLHKGERVLPIDKAKRYERTSKRMRASALKKYRNK